jgi:hypothetical protein
MSRIAEEYHSISSLWKPEMLERKYQFGLNNCLKDALEESGEVPKTELNIYRQQTKLYFNAPKGKRLPENKP